MPKPILLRWKAKDLHREDLKKGVGEGYLPVAEVSVPRLSVPRLCCGSACPSAVAEVSVPRVTELRCMLALKSAQFWHFFKVQCRK